MTDAPNTWNTMQVRAWDKPQLLNSGDVPVPNHDIGFPLGFNWLDLDKGANLRTKGYADNQSANSVRLHLDAWADTTLYSAGLTWLDICKNDRDFQWGTFVTTEDHPWDKPKMQTSRNIKFAKPYAEPPKVVVWLNEIDLDKNHNWRVKCFADNITKDGFTLHCDTWADTILYSAGATWIAHPSNRSNITSGSYNTMDVRPWDQPRATNGKSINFDKKFQKTPLVLTGLNTFDIGNTANLRIRALLSNISSTGMTWNVDCWADTTLYSGGCNYLVIQDY